MSLPLTALLAKLWFLQVLRWVFLGIVVIQVLSLFLSLRMLMRHRVLGEGILFLKEYWQWSHLRENFLSLSLWIGSIGAYSYLVAVGETLGDLSLTEALKNHPYAVGFVELGSLGLIGYSLLRLRGNLIRTRQIRADLKKLKTFRALRNKVRIWQTAGGTKPPWAQLPRKALTGLTQWVERVVHAHISRQVRQELALFFLVTSLDYLCRMSVIFVALFVVKGELFLPFR